tara:strand:+ start:367 stop:819 length:453 start_codon:yes stop_codon:yes gene_type:complete
MKRLHVHIAVEDLDQSIAYYGALFGTEPQKVRPGYARWMLDDPKVNFAISSDRGTTGISHLGLQADDDDELAVIEERIAAAGGTHDAAEETHCCYARTRQGWATDPQGIRWEAFVTRGDSEIMARTVVRDEAETEEASCCAPTCCAPAAE